MVDKIIIISGQLYNTILFLFFFFFAVQQMGLKKSARKIHRTGLVRDENGERKAREKKVIKVFLELVVCSGPDHAFPL